MAWALCLSVLLVASTWLQAQSSSDKQKFHDMAKQLKLTSKQKTQLIPILESEASKVRAVRSNTSLSRPQQLEQLREVREENNPKLKAILTPEQFQQLNVIRKTDAEQQ